MKRISHPIWQLRPSESEDNQYVLVRTEEERDVGLRVAAGQRVQLIREGQMASAIVIIVNEDANSCEVQHEDELIEEIPIEFLLGAVEEADVDPFTLTAEFDPADYPGAIGQTYTLDKDNDYGLPENTLVENTSQMWNGSNVESEDLWTFKLIGDVDYDFTIYSQSAGGNMTPDISSLPDGWEEAWGNEAVPPGELEGVPPAGIIEKITQYGKGVYDKIKGKEKFAPRAPRLPTDVNFGRPYGEAKEYTEELREKFKNEPSPYAETKYNEETGKWETEHDWKGRKGSMMNRNAEDTDFVKGWRFTVVLQALPGEVDPPDNEYERFAWLRDTVKDGMERRGLNPPGFTRPGSMSYVSKNGEEELIIDDFLVSPISKEGGWEITLEGRVRSESSIGDAGAKTIVEGALPKFSEYDPKNPGPTTSQLNWIEWAETTWSTRTGAKEHPMIAMKKAADRLKEALKSSPLRADGSCCRES